MIFTYRDFTVHLADFLSGSDEKDARDYRRAAVQALREAADAYPWTHYVTPARLNVFGPFTEGTVEYDATGGAYERLVTLSDSTWPAWAQDGMIDLDGFKCEVSRVIDTTRLTLAERACPPADIGAGTEYSLYRESYPAPADFYKPVTGLYTEGGVLGPEYVEPSRILESGRCRAFTIVGSTNYQGALAFRFHPVPQEDASYSYWYRRTPRSLTVEAESTGTIAVTAGSTTVTGTGTAFSQQHVGCVLRLSANTDLPTGYDGDNPAQVERVIVSVASTTGLEVDAAYDETASGRAFLISDPVDVAPHMLDYLLRCAEYRLSQSRNRTDGLSAILSDKQAAFRRAASADAKSMGRRIVGRGFAEPVIGPYQQPFVY